MAWMDPTVCRPLMGRPPLALLGRMFPSPGSQPRCCSRRRLGGSSVPLFSRASSRELVYCPRELAARPVRSSSLSPHLPVRTHVRCLVRCTTRRARTTSTTGSPAAAVARAAAEALVAVAAAAAAIAAAAAAAIAAAAAARRPEHMD